MTDREGRGRRGRRPGAEGGEGTGGPEPLGKALSEYLRKHGLDAEVEGHRVVEGWTELVGDRIAGVARPTGVARGILYVEVASSAWMNELDLMRRDILERVNEGRTHRIERILFRLAERPSGSGPS